MKGKSSQLKSQGGTASKHPTNNNLQMRRNRRRNGRKSSSSADENFTPAGKATGKGVFRKPKGSKQSFVADKDDYDDDSNSSLPANDSRENIVKVEQRDDELQPSQDYDSSTHVNGQDSTHGMSSGETGCGDDATDLPAKPGTAIKLHGVVLHETAGGLIVLNVRWRNKIYSGALIDVEKTKWAGERIERDNCVDLMADVKSITTTKNHGKRGRRAWTTSEKHTGKNAAVEGLDSAENADVDQRTDADHQKPLNSADEANAQDEPLSRPASPQNGLCSEGKLSALDEHEVNMRLTSTGQPIPDPPGGMLYQQLPYPATLCFSAATDASSDGHSMLPRRSPGSDSSMVDESAAVEIMDTSVDIESNDTPSSSFTKIQSAPSIVVHECRSDEGEATSSIQSHNDGQRVLPSDLTEEQLQRLQQSDYIATVSLMPPYVAGVVQLSPTLSTLNPQSLNRSLTDALMPTAESGDLANRSETSREELHLERERLDYPNSALSIDSRAMKRPGALSANNRQSVEEELIAASDDETYEAVVLLPGLSGVSLATECNSFEKWKEKMELRFPTLCDDSAELDPAKRAKVSLLLASDDESNEETQVLLAKLRQKAAVKHGLMRSSNRLTCPETLSSLASAQYVGTRSDREQESIDCNGSGADGLYPNGRLSPLTSDAQIDVVREHIPVDARSPNETETNVASRRRLSSGPLDGIDPQSDHSSPVHSKVARHADPHSDGDPLRHSEIPSEVRPPTGPDSTPQEDRHPIVAGILRDTSALCPPQLVPDAKHPPSGRDDALPIPRAPSFLQPNISAGRPISKATNKPDSITGNTSFGTSTRTENPVGDDLHVERSDLAPSIAVSVDFTHLRQSATAAVDVKLTSPSVAELGSIHRSTSASSVNRTSPDLSAVVDRTLVGAKTWIPQEVYSQGRGNAPSEETVNRTERRSISPGRTTHRHGESSPVWRGKAGHPVEFGGGQSPFHVVDGRHPSSVHGFTIATSEPLQFAPVPGLAARHVKMQSKTQSPAGRVQHHPVPIAPAPVPLADRPKVERDLPLSITMDHDGPHMSRYTFTHDRKLVLSPMENRGRPRKVRVERTQQIPIGKPQDMEGSRGAPLNEPPSQSSRKQVLTPTGGNSVRTSVIHGGRGKGEMIKPTDDRLVPESGRLSRELPPDTVGYYSREKRLKLDTGEELKSQQKHMSGGPRPEPRPIISMKGPGQDTLDVRSARSPVAARSPIDHAKRQGSPSLPLGSKRSSDALAPPHPPMHSQWNRGPPFMVNPMVVPQIGYPQGFPPYFVGRAFQQPGAGRGSPHPPLIEHASPRSPALDKKDMPPGLDPPTGQKRSAPDVKLPPSEFFAFDPKYPLHAHLENIRSNASATSSPVGYATGYPGRDRPPSSSASAGPDVHQFELKRDMSPAISSADLMHNMRHGRVAYYSSPGPTGGSGRGLRLDKRPDGNVVRPPDVEPPRLHLQPGQLIPSGAYHEKGQFATSQPQLTNSLMSMSNNLIFSRADGSYVCPVSYDQRQMDAKR